jgi:hypothetical protein
MRVDLCDKETFAGYMTALQTLEEAFIMAGALVSFYCLDSLVLGKTVLIKRGDAKIVEVSIEGDSPAQAIKDVAAAIRLSEGADD